MRRTTERTDERILCSDIFDRDDVRAPRVDHGFWKPGATCGLGVGVASGSVGSGTSGRKLISLEGVTGSIVIGVTDVDIPLLAVLAGCGPGVCAVVGTISHNKRHNLKAKRRIVTSKIADKTKSATLCQLRRYGLPH